MINNKTRKKINFKNNKSKMFSFKKRKIKADNT